MYVRPNKSKADACSWVAALPCKACSDGSALYRKNNALLRKQRSLTRKSGVLRRKSNALPKKKNALRRRRSVVLSKNSISPRKNNRVLMKTLVLFRRSKKKPIICNAS